MVANKIILETENVFRSKLCKTRFKRRATAVPNSIDRIKFDFSTVRSSVTFESKSCYTAVARLGFKRRAIAVPNSIHKS